MSDYLWHVGDGRIVVTCMLVHSDIQCLLQCHAMFYMIIMNACMWRYIPERVIVLHVPC